MRTQLKSTRMTALELRTALEDWTAQNCGLETRDYLGMSTVGKCPAEMYYRATGSGPDGRFEVARYCYEGLLHQEDLIQRLKAMHLYEPAPELVASFDDRVRGHPDGIVDGRVMDIKSVTRDTFYQVKQSQRAPDEHYAQVQCYMLYGKFREAILLYKCRETGKIWPLYVLAQEGAQRRIEEKIKRVLAAIDRGVPPACECGEHH